MPQETRPSVTAVIVTYNRLDKLKRAIACLVAQDFDALVIVNNASTDDTRTWLDGLDDPRFHIIHMPDNTGGAGGFFTGMTYAANQLDGDWILCLDDDAYAAADALETFRLRHAHTIETMVASAVRGTNGALIEMNRPLCRLPVGLLAACDYFIRRRKYIVPDTAYQATDLVDIAACSFVGVFIRRDDIVSRIGYPRKEFFLYCDDLLYTASAGQAGCRLTFDPLIHFSHDCDNDKSRVYGFPWKVYYLVRNYIEFYRETNHKAWLAPALIRSVHTLFNIHRSPDPGLFIKCLYLGMRDGFLRQFGRSHGDLLR